MKELLREILEIEKEHLYPYIIEIYKELMILSPDELVEILSKPSCDSGRLTLVIFVILGYRDIGKEITAGDKSRLLEFAKEDKDVELLQKGFDLYQKSKLCGDILVKLLPNYPLTQMTALLDRLILMAPEQDQALFNATKAITTSKTVYLPSDALKAYLERLYTQIKDYKRIEDEKAFNKDVKSVLSLAFQENHLLSISTILMRYYNRRRELNGNIASEVIKMHESGDLTLARIPSVIDQRKEYEEITRILNNTNAEYKQARTKSKLYIL